MDNCWITTAWLAGKLLGTNKNNIELMLRNNNISPFQAWADLEVNKPKAMVEYHHPVNRGWTIRIDLAHPPPLFPDLLWALS